MTRKNVGWLVMGFGFGLSFAGLLTAAKAADEAITGTSGTLTISKMVTGCTVATISSDESRVAIDWACVEESAKQPMKGDVTAAWARVLKAIHDGTAVNK